MNDSKTQQYMLEVKNRYQTDTGSVDCEHDYENAIDPNQVACPSGVRYILIVQVKNRYQKKKKIDRDKNLKLKKKCVDCYDKRITYECMTAIFVV